LGANLEGMAVEQSARRRSPEQAVADSPRDPLSGRLGLSVPHEWWASAPLLKSYEAAGFGWVQLHSPPMSVLTVARLTTQHAVAAAAALGTTSLRSVLHAPSSLRAGTREHDRAFEGVLSYAAEIGATGVVYHALALPEGRESEPALVAEARSLTRHAKVAERLDLTIAIENLAPLYPGPETLSANPALLRGLARRVGSPAISVCLDLGHAHIAADLRNTSVELLCEPVLDLVSVFHIHDNLGARRRQSGEKLGVDPLRLDLHLPPGRGTLPWGRIAPRLAQHRAPLICEVHPPFRPRSAEVAASVSALFS
jgi:sugar phosphate isomerase/epimerase